MLSGAAYSAMLSKGTTCLGPTIGEWGLLWSYSNRGQVVGEELSEGQLSGDELTWCNVNDSNGRKMKAKK